MPINSCPLKRRDSGREYVFYSFSHVLPFSDTSHKNSKLFKIDDESGKLTYNAEDKIYGPKPVRVIATDRGNPPLNNTDPYMVNVYFLRPGEQINITMALKAFESEDDGWLGAAMSDFGTYIIGAIIGIAIICLIVLVVVIIK